MIDLLGKRPFVGRGDDMDKWLDANMKQQPHDVPPPVTTETEDGPTPAPVVTSKAVNLEDFRS